MNGQVTEASCPRRRDFSGSRSDFLTARKVTNVTSSSPCLSLERHACYYSRNIFLIRLLFVEMLTWELFSLDCSKQPGLESKGISLRLVELGHLI